MHPLCDRLVTTWETHKAKVPIHEIRNGFDHDTVERHVA